MKEVSPLFGEIMYWAKAYADKLQSPHLSNRTLAIIKSSMEQAIAVYLVERKTAAKSRWK